MIPLICRLIPCSAWPSLCLPSCARIPAAFLFQELLYAKIYEQIFDSSLAENYQVRHVFEDLLKLADQEGVVDRTHEAISRRTNVPLEIVRMAIAELEKPDGRSKSKAHEGRRIIRLEEHRDWGWKIVNHGYYRKLKNADEKRQADKDRQRKNRNGKELPEKKLQMLQNVTYAYASVSESEDRGCGGKGNFDASVPTIEEVASEASMRMIKQETAKKFFNHHNDNSLWFNQFGKLINWRSKLKTWSENERASYGTNQKAGRVGADRNAGTANAKRIGQYDGVGKVP